MNQDDLSSRFNKWWEERECNRTGLVRTDCTWTILTSEAMVIIKDAYQSGFKAGMKMLLGTENKG